MTEHMREFLEWLVWAVIFGAIIASTLWVVAVAA
jgi:hypothetical protein